MNKENSKDKVFIFCVILLLGAIMLDGFWDKEKVAIVKGTPYESNVVVEPTKEVITEESVIEETITEEVSEKDVNTESLFIGDSRTVGIKEFSEIKESTFFAKTGMSVYSVNEEVLNVEGMGEMSLEQVLASRKFGMVYLMLGINELGYDFGQTVLLYEELIEQVRKAQPQAMIILQANLHVAKERSDSDTIVNNDNIDKFNQEISRLANGENIFYLDANVLFDDENGNLSADTNNDNVHLKEGCYQEWGQWIMEQTKILIK